MVIFHSYVSLPEGNAMNQWYSTRHQPPVPLEQLKPSSLASDPPMIQEPQIDRD